ncbi:MAG TPA: hypothetical protein VF545_00165 [Thermoleophilaceae bacterium]
MAADGGQEQGLAYQNAQRGVEDLDPLSWTFVKAMVVEFVVFNFLLWMLSLLAVPVFLVGMVVGGTGAVQPLGVLFAIVYGGLWLFFFFFFRPIPVQLSEWKFLADDAAAAAPSAFEHVTWAFRRRRSPIDSLRVRRVGLAPRPSRDYLEVREGVFTGYVSCFAYGGDLYIGWTFWWRLSPFRWFLIALGRLWQTLTLRATQIHIMARYEGAKALREAIHAAACEGVDVAAGKIAARGTGTIGSEIPVDVVGSPAELPGFLARAESGAPAG